MRDGQRQHFPLCRRNDGETEQNQTNYLYIVPRPKKTSSLQQYVLLCVCFVYFFFSLSIYLYIVHSILTDPEGYVEHHISPHDPDAGRIHLDPAPRAGGAVAVGREGKQHAHEGASPDEDVEAAHKSLLFAVVVYAEVHGHVVQHRCYRHGPEDLGHLMRAA